MPTSIEGFIYVEEHEVGRLATSRPGARIALRPRRPPWIVVSHELKSVCVAHWPGRLWRARIVDMAGVPQPLSYAAYNRAAVVDILEEVPAHKLFGEHGARVCTVIAKAKQLQLSQVKGLANARSLDASKAYSRAWNTWLTRVNGSSSYEGEDLTSTLGIIAGGSRSPINNGLTVVYQTVCDRAKVLSGPEAFLTNEDGDVYLEPTWATAADAMIEAAMAFGAPEICDAKDRDIMSVAWRSVIGPDPIASTDIR